MERKITNLESISIGKTQYKNDDAIYCGSNYVAVIDGVSHKSTIIVGEKKIKIADLIVDAIKKIDNKNAPSYAKSLNFDEFITIINMYIKKSCDKISHDLLTKPLEATAAIYSKFYNQIWLIGDCQAIYDGISVTNDLKIDSLTTEIRIKIANELLKNGYSKNELLDKNLPSVLMKSPKDIPLYISNSSPLISFIHLKLRHALLECGFTNQEIDSQNLLAKFDTPKKLQQYVKNNPNVNSFGYSVLNGIYTEPKNCKIINLPGNIHEIQFSTDGFPLKVLETSKNFGEALRKNRILASKDPLCIYENKNYTGTSKQSNRFNYFSFDDCSGIKFKIENNEERTL